MKCHLTLKRNIAILSVAYLSVVNRVRFNHSKTRGEYKPGTCEYWQDHNDLFDANRGPCRQTRDTL